MHAIRLIDLGPNRQDARNTVSLLVLVLSDDNCPHKGEPIPALKLQPGACPALVQHLESPDSVQQEIPTKDNAHKAAQQQHSFLCSGSLLIYHLHCGSVTGCISKYKSKGSCSEPNASTQKPSLGHLNPCGLLPSVLLAAQFSLSTAAPGTDLLRVC